MSATKDGWPAQAVLPRQVLENRLEVLPEGGMTLRDWFAGQALASCMVGEFSSTEQCARYCYSKADAMLAAREGGAK